MGVIMSFIYKTTNKINGKIYIGKSKTNDPKYLGSGMILKQSIEKYGTDAFIKEILEECSENIVDEREIFWINKLRSFERDTGYNIALGGAGGDTTTHHPQKTEIVEKRKHGLAEWHKSLTKAERLEHAKKISEAKKGKSNGREGCNHSEESITKIKANQPPKTDEWKKSHTEAMAKRSGVPLIKKYKKVRVDGIEYESVTHAIKCLGLKHAKYFHDMRKKGKIKVEYL